MKLTANSVSQVSYRLRVSAAILVLVGATLTVAAGSANASSKIHGVKNLRVAYITGGSLTTFLQVENTVTVNTLKKAGAHVQMFDPAFNPTTEYNMMQSVISGGAFNAIILLPLSGVVMCPLVKQAIKRGITVVTGINSVCGLDNQNGSRTWYPGTLQAVSGQTPSWFEALFQYVKSQNSNGGQVAIFTGPSILPLSTNTNNAATKVFAGSNLSVVSAVAGDYTAPTALTAAEAVFKANPNISIVVSNYAGMTPGIIAAATSAGILNKIKIYDAGGTTQEFPLIQNGTIAASGLLVPRAIGKQTAKALIQYAQGKKVPKWSNVGDLPIFITASNYTQYLKFSY
jgi:ribose transport system substrate-binding protein